MHITRFICTTVFSLDGRMAVPCNEEACVYRGDGICSLHACVELERNSVSLRNGRCCHTSHQSEAKLYPLVSAVVSRAASGADVT